MVSITEANQNFSKVARLVDELEISKRLLAQNKEANLLKPAIGTLFHAKRII